MRLTDILYSQFQKDKKILLALPPSPQTYWRKFDPLTTLCNLTDQTSLRVRLSKRFPSFRTLEVLIFTGFLNV